jgi:hypothetical protein
MKAVTPSSGRQLSFQTMVRLIPWVEGEKSITLAPLKRFAATCVVLLDPDGSIQIG